MRWPEHLAALMLSISLGPARDADTFLRREAPAPGPARDADTFLRREVPAPGPAPDADTFLVWEAPAACPSRRDVEAAITADLGRPIAPADADALSARAVVRRAPDRRWALSLTIEPRGAPAVERVAIADDCALLADTAALMVAVAIDPELAGRTALPAPTSREPVAIPLEPVPIASPASAIPSFGPATNESARIRPPPREPAPGRNSSPDAPSGPAPAPTPARDPAPRRPLRAALAAAAVLDVGALPRPAPGLLVRLGLLGPARVELGLLHLFERPARIAGTDRGGDLQLTAGQLAACPRLLRRRLELPLCAGLELGAMRGEGVGLAVRATDRIVWLALLADARLLWAPIPRLALGVQLGLAAPLLAARFRIDGLPGDLHRAAPVSFRGALALELRLP